jgi:3'-phosphoadenosine 5'-phosphosulfate synthase
VDFVLKRMVDDRIVISNKEPKITDSLIEALTEEQLQEFDTLKSIEVDIEQA